MNEILDLLLEDINDEEIKKWVNCEINGYSKDDKVPEYRIVSVDIRGSYLVGSAYNGIKGTNQPLPLKSKYIDEFSSTDIKEGINELQHISTAEKDVENHSLVIPMNIIVAQEITLINGQILDASMHLPVYAYTNILEKLKSKLLLIFKELEKQYGNLDDYYIDFKNDTKEKEITKYIINIVLDKSIKIGNENNINKSNIGDDNEY